MGYESKVNIVLWKPDYEELAEKLKNNCDKQLCDVFDREGEWETPDETYVLLQTDWTKWYKEDEEYFPYVKFIMDFITDKRHIYIRFGEEKGDVETYYKSEDARGCDKKFEYLVEPMTEVTNLKLFGLAPKKYQLISICDTDRNIETQIYDTLKAAHEEMARQFEEAGGIEGSYECELTLETAYINDGNDHANYDWKIVEVEV